MSECIFCKIIKRELPSKIVFEDENVLVFEDIAPQAPLHLICIPKKHIESMAKMKDEEYSLLAHIYRALSCIAKQKNVAEQGYRLVTNTGKDAGMAVHHLHVHLLAGRQLAWPPG